MEASSEAALPLVMLSIRPSTAVRSPERLVGRRCRSSCKVISAPHACGRFVAGDLKVTAPWSPVHPPAVPLRLEGWKRLRVRADLIDKLLGSALSFSWVHSCPRR
jgi:hypothetical protein